MSLAIFIPSVSCIESLASFTNHYFHFSRPGFGMALNAAERNGRFDRNQCQIGKESGSRGKKKRRAFLCRRTMTVKVRSKVIPTSFWKVEGRGDSCWVKRPEKEGQVKEWLGDQNPGPEAPARSRKDRMRREQRRCRGRSDCPLSDKEE